MTRTTIPAAASARTLIAVAFTVAHLAALGSEAAAGQRGTLFGAPAGPQQPGAQSYNPQTGYQAANTAKGPRKCTAAEDGSAMCTQQVGNTIIVTCFDNYGPIGRLLTRPDIAACRADMCRNRPVWPGPGNRLRPFRAGRHVGSHRRAGCLRRPGQHWCGD